MTKQVAILHYAGPPVIGGVESTIAHHARALTALGYHVRVISGVGEFFDDRVEVFIDPLFSSSDPQVLAVKRELDQGAVSESFSELVAGRKQRCVRRFLIGCVYRS